MRKNISLLRMTCLPLFLLLSLCCAAAMDDIHQEIQTVYSFQPHTLTSEQITQRSAELDKLWAKAKANKEIYLPGLRRELADFRNPPFFLFDGSMLLLQLSDSAPDRKIALAAVAHCDLRDIQPNDYFHWVHSQAVHGENTTDAAFRILEDPKFQVIVPQHALTLGQNYALIYMLLPTDQQFWLQPAIDRLKNEKDLKAQESLLLLLWYAQDVQADQAILAFQADSTRPEEARQYAHELQKREKTFKGGLGLSSEAELRRKRQQRMAAISDEALIDLDQFTMRLSAARRR